MGEKTMWYDNEEDILGIRIDEGDYWKTIELPNGINIDISKEGKITGFEIFNASKIFSGNSSKILEAAVKMNRVKNFVR